MLDTIARPGWPARWVSFVAIVALLAQVCHWTLVSHRVCATHGELVHESDLGHALEPQRLDHDSADSVAAADHTGANRAQPGESVDDDHNHCHAFLNSSVTSAPLAPPVATVTTWQGLTRGAPEFIAPSGRRYRFAPKTSPPSA